MINETMFNVGIVVCDLCMVTIVGFYTIAICKIIKIIIEEVKEHKGS